VEAAVLAVLVLEAQSEQVEAAEELVLLVGLPQLALVVMAATLR
jgi:hypothetical protein